MKPSGKIMPEFMTCENKKDCERIGDPGSEVGQVKWIAVKPLDAGNSDCEKADNKKTEMDNDL